MKFKEGDRVKADGHVGTVMEAPATVNKSGVPYSDKDGIIVQFDDTGAGYPTHRWPHSKWVYESDIRLLKSATPPVSAAQFYKGLYIKGLLNVLVARIYQISKKDFH
jgi:hypothetical protein